MIPSARQITRLLRDPAPRLTNTLILEARRLTLQHFGRTIRLYAPLYLSNYCSSHCTYCGFHSRNRIHRVKLTPSQIDEEMRALAETGIQSVLLLTGESYKATPLPYLKTAVGLAKKYFTGIALEVHPLSLEEYRELFETGADGITVYQETYDRRRYEEVHLSGQKKDYDFRYQTPQRAAQAGIRFISLGVLLGLADPGGDLHALYRHLVELEHAFPGVEYNLSFPRLRPVRGQTLAPCPIDEETFIRILCLTRIVFPHIGITLSTREPADLRDRLLGVGVTRLSAGSRTTVGGYHQEKSNNDPQFDIDDNRSVPEILRALKAQQFDPVLTEWRPIPNTSKSIDEEAVS